MFCSSDLPPSPFVLLEACCSIYSIYGPSVPYVICVRIFPLCFSVNLIVYVCVRLIFPLSIYMCSSDLPPLFYWRPVVQSYSIYVYMCPSDLPPLL